MDEVENQPPTPPEQSSQSKPFEWSPGQILDNHFRIDEKLGSGGMSEVFAAHDLNIGRKVAIKFMHPWLISDSSYLDRFQQEAKTTGKLRHEGIINIYHYGVDQRHRPYIVMDFLEGTSLSDKIEGGAKLDAAQAILILKQIVAALDYAHSLGVIHRDIKPSNVMYCESGDTVKAILVDFGIAKIVQPLTGKAVTQLARTSTGEVLGSPQYMSPEQCMGLTVDARSDIYSLGCLIYALLAGQPPFESTNVYEIYFSQMNDAPPSLKKIRPDLPEAKAFDAIILRCMAKEPKDRYQNLAEIARALDTVGGTSNNSAPGGASLTLLTGTAKDIGLRLKAGKLKIPFWKIALLTLSLSFSAASAMWYLGVWNIPAADKMQNLYLTGQKDINEAAYNEAQTGLSQALMISKTSLNLKQYVIPCLRQMLDLARCSKNKDLEADASSQLKTETQAKLKAQLGDLEQNLNAALDGSGSHSRDQVIALIDDANDTASVILEIGETRKSIELLKKAEALSDKYLSPPHIVSKRSLHNLGLCYYLSGDLVSAEKYLNSSLKFGSQQLSPSDPALLDDLVELSRICMDSGRFDQASEYLTRALSISRHSYGADSDKTAFIKTNQAQLKLSTGHKDLAVRELRQAKALFDNCRNADETKYARCVTLLAYTEGSKDLIAQALELQEKAWKQDSTYLVWMLQQTAAFEEKASKNYQTKYDKVAPLYRRMLAIGMRTSLENSKAADVLTDRFLSLCAAANQLNEGVYWQTLRLKLESASDKVPPERIIQTSLHLARLQTQVGNVAEARKIGTQSLEQARAKKLVDSECMALTFLIELFRQLQDQQTAKLYEVQLKKVLSDPVTAAKLTTNNQTQAQKILDITSSPTH